MNPIKKYIVIPLVAIAGIFALLYINQVTLSKLHLKELNENLKVENVKMGMDESELIRQWGNGDVNGGWGGHARGYKEKHVNFMIGDDSDSSMYKKIDNIEIWTPEYSVFGISIGNPVSEAIAKLKGKGYKATKDREIYSKGEITIAVRGYDKVTFLQIWFRDWHLRGRVY